MWTLSPRMSKTKAIHQLLRSGFALSVEACATLSFSPAGQFICKYTLILGTKKKEQ